MTPQSLELSGIGKGFGADDVLKEIDLSIRPGEFCPWLACRAVASPRCCAS